MSFNARHAVAVPGTTARPRFAPVSRARLPTNTTANRHAIHRWFNFIAGFAPEFVAHHCPENPGGLLLDPFAGCGTSLVVAQFYGHKAVGFEPHPFFLRIARAKTAAPPTEHRLRKLEAALLNGLYSPQPIDSLSDAAAAFLRKLFETQTLTQLLGSRASLHDAGLDNDDLAFLLLSRVVEMCSRSQTDGIYKAPSSRKKAATPIEAIRNVIDEVRSDTAQASSSNGAPRAVVHSDSALDMSSVKSGSVDVAITSPPYLNNFDFAEMTRMELYFWGICDSWRDITATVRSKLVVNTTTALMGHRDSQAQHRAAVPTALLNRLDSIVRALAKERRVRAGKKEYDLLVYPYFSQMTQVLRETLRCLRTDAELHVVVADAAFYGIHVATPQLLADAMSEVGFRAVVCKKLRDRGHRWILDKRDGSPIGLGEYHISAKRGGTN